jgi:hypothetical protein
LVAEARLERKRKEKEEEIARKTKEVCYFCFVDIVLLTFFLKKNLITIFL